MFGHRPNESADHGSQKNSATQAFARIADYRLSELYYTFFSDTYAFCNLLLRSPQHHIHHHHQHNANSETDGGKVGVGALGGFGDELLDHHVHHGTGGESQQVG